ncbi:uncharacterized protein RCC_08321 [Ramularia collo-cygni]|uniref:Yeast cell wall synthesis Kre9/Knh1-like N-terminal domain-containing protein n=1 Tax=Ramularia collo-cygni TaxID=112498 RepID=A0A2D3UZU2_9PEZI|nr:uncharacterized protein RCC_08321 [Ramularia collo-cygni]CZT22451.1 uncharacterized protein RCC_08321 [Ramularia collo-cygni]
MSDFSLFSLFTAGLACMVPFAAAYTQPVGAEPKGNPISQPGLNSLVPAGEGFTITWKPTTEGPVTLILLKGPATNLKLESVIVEGTENDGSYTWTPSTSLEPTADATGYGIQLIVDSGAEKGQYQYTTQFGISNPEYKESSSSSSSSSSAAPSSSAASAPSYGHSSAASAPSYGHASSTSEALKTATASGEPSFYTAPSVMYPTASANQTVMPTGGHAKPTGWTTKNSTVVAPTGYLPSTTLKTTGGASASAPTESVPVSTGAASTMTTSFFGLALAAGVAVLAY